ncbi:MAG TPA: YetF domain-containing protein [Noviherbaspirillum sp.]|nr:YetF domain-containing protein [Noviherbaspirillum sp.]
MDQLFSIDWEDLFSLSVPLGELIVRGTAMYWFLFLIFRFVVRRDVGAVGIADLLVLVIVADAAQNAMAGEYRSVTDGMVLVGTLIGWNVFFDWISYTFPWFRRLAEPDPIRLIWKGRMLYRNMRRELITDDELWSKLRQAGVENLDEVKEAYIESDGQISIIKNG